MSLDHRRRALLRSTIAAALASPLLGLPGCSGGDAATPAGGRRLNFALPASSADAFVLHVGTARYPLQRHASVDDPALARAAGALAVGWFAEGVQLPADRVQLLRVTRRPAAGFAGVHRLAMVHVHAPSARLAAEADRIATVRRRMGLRVAEAAAFDRYGEFFTAIDTATSIVFTHPELMALDPDAGATVIAHIQAAEGFDLLWQEIAQRPDSVGDEGSWCESVPVAGADGTPYRDPASGDVVYDHRVMPDILELAAPVMHEALRATREDETLRDRLWSVSAGRPDRVAQAPVTAQTGAGGYRIATSKGRDEREGGVYFDAAVDDAGSRTLRIELENAFLRWGAVSVEFRDARGEAIALDESAWRSLAPSGVLAGSTMRRFLEDAPSMRSGPARRYLDLLPPQITVLAIPMHRGHATVRFAMPEAATSAVVRMGTLGQDFAWLDARQSEFVGFSLTYFASYLAPMITLTLGTGATTLGTLASRLAFDPQFVLGVLQFTVAACEGTFDERRLGNLLLRLADQGAKLLLDRTFAPLMAEILAGSAALQAAEAVPLVGWALRAATVTATIAGLIRTTAEVCSARSRVECTVTLALDVEVTVNPDLDDGRFPATARTIEARLNVAGATGYASEVVTLPAEGRSAPVVLRFPDVVSGATGQVVVLVRDAAGALVGKGTAARYAPTLAKIAALQAATSEFAAVDAGVVSRLAPLAGRTFETTAALLDAIGPLIGDLRLTEQYRRTIVARLAEPDIALVLPGGAASSTLSLDCTIREQLVALTEATRYRHRRVLGFTGGRYAWRADVARPVEPLTCDNADDALCELGGITFNQRANRLAYAWRASSPGLPLCGTGTSGTQAWTVQGVSALDDPQAALRTLSVGGTACGIADGAGVVFELLGPSDGSGANFLLDGRGGRVHVRRIDAASATSLDLAVQTRSLGAFSRLPTAVAWHPRGLLVGVHAPFHKIEVLDLLGPDHADADAPDATLFAGQGVRAGLFLRPTCVAVTLDGRILVLEEGNRRVQALDRGAMPVACFGGTPFMALRDAGDDARYLDMGVDATGHVFVLRRTGDGLRAADHELEIYRPDGTFLSATPGFSAGRFTVDLWRNLYTLNRERLRGPGGRTEPTVSEWVPG